MTYRIVSRTDIGLDPIVRHSTGDTRPKLANERWMTLHWTGVNVSYSDIGDTGAEIRSIERWAAGQKKPNEYNYVIGQDPDDLLHEYSGAFQAAHSAGENLDSIGVLFLNGTGEPVTDLQIDKARWLRDVLRYYGVLRFAPDVTPHRGMPGANTTCPGDRIAAAAPVINQPWQEPTEPTPATSTSVLLTRVLPGDGWWTIARRCYGTNVAANAARLEAANPSTVLRPGALVNVPGRAS